MKIISPRDIVAMEAPEHLRSMISSFGDPGPPAMLKERRDEPILSPLLLSKVEI